MRCSSLDRVLLCPQSAYSPDVRVEGDDAGARLGTAFHYWIRAVVRPDLFPFVAVGDVAAMHRVDDDDLGILCSLGEKCWEAVKAEFPDPQVEVELDENGDLGLTGHADLVSVPSGDVTEARILDWKTSYGESDHTEQLRGYAYLVMQRTGASQAYVCIVRVRDQQRIGLTYTRAELDAWYLSVVNKLQGDNLPYVPSTAACSYCPRGATCEGKTALLRQSVETLEGVTSSVDFSTLSGERLLDLHLRLKQVEGFLGNVGEIIKAEVASRGGAVTAPDGDGLEIVRQERREIDAARAWPILLPMLGDSLMASVKLGKGKIEDAIKATAPRGKGAAAIRDTMARLDEAGAIRVSELEILKVRKSLKAVQQQDNLIGEIA